MATVTKTGSLTISAGNTQSTAITFLTGQSTGIYAVSAKFENNSSSVYLSPNGAGKIYKIFIKGTTSGSKQLYSKTIDGNGVGLNNIPTNGTADCANTILKGDIQIYATLNESFAVNCGFVNTVKITLTYSTLPVAPTINYPVAASKTTYNSKPYFKMTGTGGKATLTYQYKIDSGGTWTNVATSVTSGTAKEWQPSSAVSAAAHTLYIRTYDGTSYSSEVTRTFTYAVPTSVVVGELVTRSPNMTNLKTYIDNLSGYYGTGSGTTITAPTQGAPLASADWTNYVAKINATPHISDLNVPGVGTPVLASYYNSYITKLQSG